jgi:hypothetical protein
MPFQTVVNRNFTTGFPGEIVRDGPTRAKAIRISALSAALKANPRFTGNLIGRVYGYTGEVPATGQTLAALAPTVALGGPVYAGLLIHPKHYALQGNSVDGPLGASLAVPDGIEGEVADMVIAIAEVFNISLTAQSITPAYVVGYIPNNVDAAKETTGIPFGALVAAPTAAALTDAGGIVIPGAKILNTISLSASAVGAPVAGLTIVQLTL